MDGRHTAGHDDYYAATVIANSCAHAFANGVVGSITVSLSTPHVDGATIVFADSGPGFTETSDSKRHRLGLIKRLIEHVGVDASFGIMAPSGILKAVEVTMPGVNFSLQSATVPQRAAGCMQRDLGDGGRMSDAGHEIRPP